MVSQDCILARLEHGGAQLGGDNHPKNEENNERSDRNRQGDAGGQGMPNTTGEVRGSEKGPRPRRCDGTQQILERVPTPLRRHGTQPRGL